MQKGSTVMRIYASSWATWRIEDWHRSIGALPLIWKSCRFPTGHCSATTIIAMNMSVFLAPIHWMIMVSCNPLLMSGRTGLFFRIPTCRARNGVASTAIAYSGWIKRLPAPIDTAAFACTTRRCQQHFQPMMPSDFRGRIDSRRFWIVIVQRFPKG